MEKNKIIINIEENRIKSIYGFCKAKNFRKHISKLIFNGEK